MVKFLALIAHMAKTVLLDLKNAFVMLLYNSMKWFLLLVICESSPLFITDIILVRIILSCWHIYQGFMLVR